MHRLRDRPSHADGSTKRNRENCQWIRSSDRMPYVTNYICVFRGKSPPPTIPGIQNTTRTLYYSTMPSGHADYRIHYPAYTTQHAVSGICRTYHTVLRTKYASNPEGIAQHPACTPRHQVASNEQRTALGIQPVVPKKSHDVYMTFQKSNMQYQARCTQQPASTPNKEA